MQQSCKKAQIVLFPFRSCKNSLQSLQKVICRVNNHPLN